MKRDAEPIRLSDDARKRAIASIREYFSTELDTDIGDLKGGLVLDYFLVEIGPAIYNAAIADAKSFFDDRAADLAALCVRDEFTYWAQARKRKQ